MSIFEDPKFIISTAIAIIALIINLVQGLNYRRVKGKIKIWSKNAKGMVTSIVGLQENIKNKKVSSLDAAISNLETLSNFANSMYTSMEEEMGKNKKDITK